MLLLKLSSYKLLALSMIAVVIAASCQRHPQNCYMDFILSDEFRGVITIIKSKDGYSPVGYVHNYCIIVPSNGIVKLHDLDCFTAGVHDRFITTSGKVLESLDLLDDLNTVQVFSIGRSAVYVSSNGIDDQNESVRYFVGTRNEYEKQNPNDLWK